MAISGVSNSLSQTQAFQSLFKVNQVTSSKGGQDADGDNDGSTGKVGKTGKTSASSLIDSLLKALQQMGANSATTGASSSTSTSANANSTTTDPKQALGDFLKSLMAAIHAEADKTVDSATSATKSNKLETGLQNLINDLSATSSSQSTSGSSSSGNSLDVVLTNLQQSANSLFAATGVASSNNNLSTLLQSLQQSMMGGSTTGNFVNSVA